MRPLALVVFLTGTLLLLLHLGRADIRGGEEGRHAVMARNAARHASQLLNPSPEPAGAPGRTPFLYPAVAAAFLRLPGPAEGALRLPSSLAVLAAAAALGLLAARGAPLAGVTAMGLFLLSPLALIAGRLATPDAAATLFAVLGFASSVTAARSGNRPGLALSGVLLGLSFLCRPWVCLPAVAGSLVAPAAAPHGRHDRPERRLLTLAAAFALTAGSHWILVSLFSPLTWNHWVDALTAPLITRPVGASWPNDAHLELWATLAPALPLIALGLLAHLRDPFEPLHLATMAWAAASLVARPVPMDGPGALMFLPAWCLVGAAGAVELSRWATVEQWRYPWSARIGIAALVAAAGAAFIPVFAPALRPLGGPLAVGLDLAGWAALLWLIAGRYATQPLKLAAAATGLLTVLGAQAIVTLPLLHRAESRSAYREAGALLATTVQGAALDAVAFVAPDPEALAFYVYRRGVSWAPGGRIMDPGAFLDLADGRHARAYVVPAGPAPAREGAEPPSGMIEWLATNKAERTAELGGLLGSPPPCRVFVNGAPNVPPMGPARPPGVPERKAIIHPEPQPRRYRRL
ncbi:MAG: glycosyltransferase family 39 protein [Candidatus Eisenbacteria bacterium]|nr:glycosyltransferase family 39 protein [Candidatus Eisenbacteria bacterium]